MNLDVPYMPSVKNLTKIFDSIQHAAVPDTFSYEFLKDLGYSSSNDRAILKVLKYLGMLDASGRPQTSYRDFVDHTKTKQVLAARLQAAYDDLYASNKKAHEQTADNLKGWFKSKTGKGDAVALKMATTFKSLAQYADFSNSAPTPPPETEIPATPPPDPETPAPPVLTGESKFGLVYRLEIHLPDTQNIETYRSIFRALREELM
ncbi:MAG: DUF5343 domain-containing protein [Candidatus Competibacteraceae bacterium]|nr:DUF5343 domain-containing protein [Candidatus Competibacteraceae bacterium]